MSGLIVPPHDSIDLLGDGRAVALPLFGAACTKDAPPPAPPWEAELARAAPLTGTIRETASGRSLSAEELVAKLRTADFILLGERHDNPDHHRLQAWIVQRLLDGSRPYAVAFEMIDGDQAPALDAYLAGAPANAEGLGKALDWGNSGWPPWAFYRPIAEAALARGMPILAANLSSGLARAMARNGLSALPAPLARHLQLDTLAKRPADQTVLAAHEAEIQAVHCGLLPPQVLPSFALTQYARDAQMARVMTDHRPQEGGVVLIAGAGHVRTDRGVPFHLARLASGTRVLALAFIEASDSQSGTSVNALTGLPYDLVWFTARMDEDDYCKKIKKTNRLPGNPKP